MFAIERGSAAEHKRLLPGSSDPGETEIAAQFLSYPAQEPRRGMFMCCVLCARCLPLCLARGFCRVIRGHVCRSLCK